MSADRFLSRLQDGGAASGFAGGHAGGLASGLLTSKAGRKVGKQALKVGGIAVAGLLFALCLAAPTHALEQAKAPEDEELRARIEAQLAKLLDGTGAEIRVAVRDGEVVLQGQVRLLEQSLRAEQIAWKTPGVSDVDNELRVVPPGAGADAAIERQLRMIIMGDGRFIDTSLEIEVLSGVVRVRGMFRDPADVLALKHRIASIPGVLDVEIDALLVASHGAVRDLTAS